MKDFLKFTLATVTDRYHFVKYCIIYNQHGNVVWHHVCFGHGNNRKKEFCNDARLKRNVG